MDTDVAIRLQAWRLIRLGMNQKIIAHRMGMSASAFNRWLHREKKKPAGLGALDGMRQLLSDLKAEATLDVTSLTDEERERLEVELGATETVRRVRRRVKKQAANKTPTKGKRLARR